jgi:hypothetical protein
MGRKPVGPDLVDRVEGSPEARQEMKVLLETITGAKTMEEACAALGVKKSHMFVLRERALAAAVAALEPRPLGRPPRTAQEDPSRTAELEEEVKRLNRELKATQLRLEVAQTLASSGAEPKKNARAHGRRSDSARRG